MSPKSGTREELANGDNITMENLPVDIDQDVNMETLDPYLQLELNRIQLEHIKQQQELDRIQSDHIKLQQDLKNMKRMLIKETERRVVNANTKIPGLQRNQSRSCVRCGERAEEFCSGCGHTPYCSARCQRRDWVERHKDVCHNLAKLPGNFNVDEPAANEPTIRPAAPFRRPRSPTAGNHNEEFLNEEDYPKSRREDTGSDEGHGSGKRHIEIPAPADGSHCERCDLRFASQEAFDNHKTRSAKHADERTIKTTPRLTEPTAINGVQFAKSPRVELWKYYAPPEYAPLFGAPLKKPKSDSLKEKNNSKAANEESVKTVNSDANIPELFRNTEHLEEDVTDYTETVVGDKNDSLRKTSKDKFICNDCGRQFHNIYTRKIHMRIHTGEKPFSCNLCNQQFRHNKLIAHMRTHTGEKPHLCTVCRKQFSEKSNLNKHIKTHTGEKPHSCTLCRKQFVQSSDLNKHMRTHTGEKPYSCTVCRKRFSESGSLNRHMRTHTGEKPHLCTVCRKPFSEKGNLNNHMRTHAKSGSLRDIT